MTANHALKLIESSKYRLTQTRQILIETIFKMNAPFSASELALALKHQKDPVDLVTIYRNLPVFEDIGIVCRADFSDEMARYIVSHHGHDNHHHHHIVCRSCHKVEPIDFCVLEGQEQIFRKLGFKDVRHRLEFSAICESCG